MNANQINRGLIAAVVALALVLGLVLLERHGTKVLPIHMLVDRHTITPGYGALIYNQGPTSMRWTVTVDRSGQTTRWRPVVDRGCVFEPRELVPGDTIKVEADGFEGQMFTIK
jgi:hypothetical protein